MIISEDKFKCREILLNGHMVCAEIPVPGTESKAV
jgi:hypothetical protein